MIIKIVDSIMGSYKTTTAIEMMNKADETNKYIYITPYLDEIQRIKEKCTHRKFYEPKVFSQDGEINFKLDSLHKLLSEGKDIATTHALFKMATEATRELIYNEGYTLILDEALEVIREVNVSPDDIKMLLKEWMHEENGFIIWDTDKENKQGKYSGKFQTVRRFALNKNLVIHQGRILMWNFPPDIFNLFKESYILTYLFSSQLQKYYFDLHNIKYEYFKVDTDNGGNLIFKEKGDYSDKEVKQRLKQCIDIYDGTLNKIGDDKYSLSKTWYESKTHLHKQLKNNMINYFNNIMKTKSIDNMWGTFKKYKGKVNGKGYTKGHVSITARSTNEFQHKRVLAYSVNRFLNPILDSYFSSKGIKVNQELFALSELIQWVWRSAIRNGEEISIYIPSSRMRGLMLDWLDDIIE